MLGLDAVRTEQIGNARDLRHEDSRRSTITVRIYSKQRIASMCGRFALALPPAQLELDLGLTSCDAWEKRYNVAPSQDALVIRQRPTGERVGHLLRWGLMPRWAKDKEIGHKLTLARAETVAEKPSFRDAFRKRRCILPMSGFYEWQTVGHSGSKPKQPYYFRPSSGTLLYVAAIWERWEAPDGESLDSFAMLTTSANSLMEPIHDRLPVILDEAGMQTWLDRDATPEALQALLAPCPSEWLQTHPVDRIVGNARNEGEHLIQPIKLG